jgi:hypothetical protein
MTKTFEFLNADPTVRFRQPTGEQRAIEQVDEPNLLRSMFPYHEVPKITFDPAPEVPLNPLDELFITCTPSAMDSRHVHPIRCSKSLTSMRWNRA